MGRFHALYGAFLVIILVSGCAKPAPNVPEAVDSKQVRSIVVPAETAEIDTCEMEVRASGGSVLYRNALGVIMTDKEPSALRMELCDATVSPNREIPLAPTDESTRREELAALLRLIPAEEIGARTFVEKNPTYDGRGALIAVLDTGVELDHPMLRETTTGERKIIGFQDFSGQGRLSTEPVSVDANFIFVSEGTEYYAKDVAGENFRFGLYPASSLSVDGEELEDVGVLVYERDGKRFGRIDTDNDKKFGEETELYDYAESGAFTKLGKNRTLTTSLNILADGKTVTLCFDDGSHGTHVAGIAAGYTPGGLRGVAPGAKVIAGKIGDNRLSGGSTTTASKMLAIDYAVAQGADIINISYGIRAGSDLGKSEIDRYVDRVARETGVLFSISAGNEGPGVQTIGTPAGADLAISPGAYVSKNTARENYGYVAVEQDNMWYFSSVGPRSDGGWKPSIAAPGSAVSSLPLWAGGHENYRGTSMAAPQVSGGLALLVSGAKQAGLPTTRALVTRAVYGSAVAIPNLKWIEQGHGLMNVPAAFALLERMKGELAVEYDVSVNSPTSPDGRGKGILVRSRIAPANLFTLTVLPVFPKGTPEETTTLFLRSFLVEPSAEWISTPPSFWAHARGPRSFQVNLDLDALSPGLHSEKITVRDEKTGLVAFEVPVTVVQPARLDESRGFSYQIDDVVKVGETKRYFIDVPPGTTAVQVDIESDGQRIWGQLLNSRGRLVADIADATGNSPQAPLFAQANLSEAGVYELDVVAPPNNQRPARVTATVRAFSLEVSAAPPVSLTEIELEVQNNLGAVRLTPSAKLTHEARSETVTISGDKTDLTFGWTKEDGDRFSALELRFVTSRAFYDMMTDYPYMVYCEDGTLSTSGGLEMDSTVTLASPCEGEIRFELQGAFARRPPANWFVSLTENRKLRNPIALLEGSPLLLEPGQRVPVRVDLRSLPEAGSPERRGIITLELKDSRGRVVQSFPVER